MTGQSQALSFPNLIFTPIREIREIRGPQIS